MQPVSGSMTAPAVDDMWKFRRSRQPRVQPAPNVDAHRQERVRSRIDTARIESVVDRLEGVLQRYEEILPTSRRQGREGQ